MIYKKIYTNIYFFSDRMCSGQRVIFDVYINGSLVSGDAFNFSDNLEGLLIDLGHVSEILFPEEDFDSNFYSSFEFQNRSFYVYCNQDHQSEHDGIDTNICPHVEDRLSSMPYTDTISGYTVIPHIGFFYHYSPSTGA
jgi:hypothetical protein